MAIDVDDEHKIMTKGGGGKENREAERWGN